MPMPDHECIVLPSRWVAAMPVDAVTPTLTFFSLRYLPAPEMVPVDMVKAVTAVKKLPGSGSIDLFATTGPLVRMSRGEKKTPSLFFIHPIGGGVLCYRDLIGCFKRNYSAYGLQAPGLFDQDTPLDSIEAMAEHYVRAIQEVPEKSSARILIGHSFGGMVACKMARKLEYLGESPLQVVLIDTPGPGYMPEGFARDEEIMASLLAGDGRDQESKRVLDVIDRLPEEQRSAYYQSQLKKILPESAPVNEETLSRAVDIIKRNFSAMKNHQPDIQDGNILFFKARESDDVSQAQPEMAWVPLARGGIEIIPVPGNHISMLSLPHVSHLAEKLEDKISGLSGKKDKPVT